MKIRFAVALLSALFVSVFLSAQSTGQGSSSQSTASSQQQPSASSDQNQGQAQTDKSKDEKKKEKKDKKDKKKKQESDSEATAANANEVFSTAEADDVLKTLADGLEGHSQRLMLSAFDTSSMDGGLQFEDQIEAFFQKYEAFRVHFRIANAAQQNGKGIIDVDIELEELPRAGGNPVRKHDQMRFELEHGRKGWKIVDFRPRQFFS